jgi:hypothetical protein
MARTGLWVAAAVVVVSNLSVLGLAAVNRQGPPEATLQLTEREASLEPEGTENTGVALRLQWTDTRDRTDAGWFGREKLETLGFDCSRKPSTENEMFYLRQPLRPAYVALEFDGPAWQRYADTLTAGAHPRSPDRESRLVLIDVDRDAARLRSRYPDRTRVVIAHALVGPVVAVERGGVYVLRGRVVELVPADLHVARDMGRVIEPLAHTSARVEEQAAAPRYLATVSWGRNLEPWVESIRLAAATR